MKNKDLINELEVLRSNEYIKNGCSEMYMRICSLIRKIETNGKEDYPMTNDVCDCGVCKIKREQRAEYTMNNIHKIGCGC